MYLSVMVKTNRWCCKC